MSSNTVYRVDQELGRSGIWRQDGPLLPRLDVELTERCNNNCIHCYINQPASDRGCIRREMDCEKIGVILAEAASLGCLSVRFTGGEPLLRTDFAEIYLATRRLGMSVALNTNGTLIDEELIALFRRYPPGEPIIITLYGSTQELYEAVSRVPGSFAAATRGVNLLLEGGIPLALRSIHLPGGGRETERFRAGAEAMLKTGRPSGVTTTFMLRARRDSPAKSDRIRTLRAAPEEVLALRTRDRQAYLKEMKQFVARFMRPGGPELFNCGCGKGGSVDAYGFLQPCLLLRHPDLVYDLSGGSLEDALRDFFPRVLDCRAGNPAYLNRCASCFLKGLCDQCPAWSYMEHGVLDSPVDYLCDLAHAAARDLGLLGVGEKAWEVTDWRQRIEAFVNDERSTIAYPAPVTPR